MTDTSHQTFRHDALRPESLQDFVGQEEILGHVSIVLRAAKERGELPDHMLFAGPPGTGKTTMAGIIAAEMDLPLLPAHGPTISKASDLASLLSAIQQPSVLFIDEIHRLDRGVEEILYPAMEDGVLDIVVGEGTRARSVRIPLSPFILVGATTQAGLLSAPLRDRFGFTGRMRLYEIDALSSIVRRSAGLLGVDVTAEGAAVIASRSRGTPRISNRLLRRARDWAQVNSTATIDGPTATEALDAFGIDELGLDTMGLDILRAVCTRFKGGPVGVKTLASAVGETEATVTDVYESYLMHRGLLNRTPRGRVATAAAYEHLGLKVPASVMVDMAYGGGQMPLIEDA